jgi:hypothetical protein
MGTKIEDINYTTKDKSSVTDKNSKENQLGEISTIEIRIIHINQI